MNEPSNAAALELARRGARQLAENIGIITHATQLAGDGFCALIEEFNRLDAAEQKRQASRIQQGHHGKKGGRPRKSKV